MIAGLETPYDAVCGRLVRETERLLDAHAPLLFPVPKYGRGLEILKLLSDRLRGISYYADDLFRQNLAAQRAGGFWYRPVPKKPPCSRTRGKRRASHSSAIRSFAALQPRRPRHAFCLSEGWPL